MASTMLKKIRFESNKEVPGFGSNLKDQIRFVMKISTTTC